MFLETVMRFSQLILESIFITFVVVSSLRLCFRFASFLASRSWRRYRTFKIPRRRRWMKKNTAEEEDYKPPYCAVCLQDAAEGEKVRRITACGHCFHDVCIDPWLEKKSTCPLCRAEIPPLPPGNPLIALLFPPGVIELFTKGSFVVDS